MNDKVMSWVVITAFGYQYLVNATLADALELSCNELVADVIENPNPVLCSCGRSWIVADDHCEICLLERDKADLDHLDRAAQDQDRMYEARVF